MNKRMDIDTYKRTVFFQHISPKTTKESLEQALSKLDLTIEKCTVPRDAEGKNILKCCFSRTYQMKLCRPY